MDSDLQLIAEEYEKISKLGGSSTPAQSIDTDTLILSQKIFKEMKSHQPDIDTKTVDRIYLDLRTVVVKYISNL